jgi:hypothetical protein
VGGHESGRREVFVEDPDGYLIMVAEDAGRRPVSGGSVRGGLIEPIA